MEQVPFLPFHYMKIWEKGSSAGVWSPMVCVLSVWIQPHPAENVENTLSHPSEPSVLDFFLLPLGEFHIVFHSLINFWKLHFDVLKDIILVLPGGEVIPAQENSCVMGITGWNEVYTSWYTPFLQLWGTYLVQLPVIQTWLHPFLLRKMTPVVHNKNFGSFTVYSVVRALDCSLSFGLPFFTRNFDGRGADTEIGVWTAWNANEATCS